MLKDGKYGNILTLILIILIVAILGLLGYFGYSWFYSSNVNTKAQNAMEEFSSATQSVKKENNKEKPKETEESPVEENTEVMNPLENFSSQTTTSDKKDVSSQTSVQKTYLEGYEVLGNITIPKTNCKYPVLNQVTKKSLETAVAVLYPTNLETLNTESNTVIVGHNYRNGLFFSNNYKLTNGDKIIVEGATETVTYIIYNSYYTTPTDADYMIRDTHGYREISLSTCNDDSSQRLIIWAIEEGAPIPEI